MAHWLMKSEPEAFSIDDLKACPNSTDFWDGVRNYQARNFMRDQMKPGDQVFFYHSNCKVPGIVGVMEVVSEPYADITALDPDSKYYDPKASKENPRWFAVDLQFKEKFPDVISLESLKQNEALSDLALVRKGNRLSVMPVETHHWDAVMGML